MFNRDVLCQWDRCRTSHCSIRWVLGVWWWWKWVSRLLASSLFTLWCRQLLGLRGTQQHYTHVHIRTSTESSQAGMDMWVLATMLLTTLGSFFNNVEFWVWSEFGWCYGKQISGNVPHLSQKLCPSPVTEATVTGRPSVPHLLHPTEIYIYLKWVDW